MYIEAFTTHTLANYLTRVNLQQLPIRLRMFCLSLCGVVAGAEGWREIRDYADGHIEWFQQHGYLRDGVPVDDTIARTISRIDPEQFPSLLYQSDAGCA